MNGKTHVTVGVATCAVVAVTWFPTIKFESTLIYPAIGIVTAAVGAKLADIDISNSEMGAKHKLASKIFTHRGITHTNLFPAAVAFLLVSFCALPMTVATQFLASLIFGFGVGYVSHIFADIHNLKGTMVGWPVCHDHVHIMAVTTGTFEEPVFCGIYVLLCAMQIICTLGGWTIK